MAAGIGIYDLVPEPAFDPFLLIALADIFTAVGRPFDVRLLVDGVRPEDPLTEPGIVEALDFATGAGRSGEEHAELTVHRAGRIDGLLLWIRLWAHLDDEPIDTLTEKTSWFPVYLPVFAEPVPVQPGDRMCVTFAWHLSDDGIHPDYTGVVRLTTAQGVREEHVESGHHPRRFRAHPFYERLFSTGDGRR
jgi:protein arginine N-methyltransferase 1